MQPRFNIANREATLDLLDCGKNKGGEPAVSHARTAGLAETSHQPHGFDNLLILSFGGSDGTPLLRLRLDQ